MAKGSKAVTFSVDTKGVMVLLNSLGQDVKQASRPAAYAGAKVLYEEVKLRAANVESKKPHFFYGRQAILAAPGTKHLYRYGVDGKGGKIPFQPGNLRRSIYHTFSEDKSDPDRGVSTYHVSWNAKKAPYGFAYEYGVISKGATPFVRASVAAFPEAADAMKNRLVDFLLKRWGMK